MFDTSDMPDEFGDLFAKFGFGTKGPPMPRWSQWEEKFGVIENVTKREETKRVLKAMGLVVSDAETK